MVFMDCSCTNSQLYTLLPGRNFRGFFHTLLVIAMLCTLSSAATAQKAPSDSVSVRARHRSNTAALYSALLPGAGQVYNHKYWKVPLVVGGFATLYYISDFNNDYYHDFKNAYIARVDGDPETVDPYPTLTQQDLEVRQNYYQRNRDFCYILMGGFYVLTIVDAYVDAQLKDFEVSDKLTLKVSPSFQSTFEKGMSGGVRLTFCFH